MAAPAARYLSITTPSSRLVESRSIPTLPRVEAEEPKTEIFFPVAAVAASAPTEVTEVTMAAAVAEAEGSVVRARALPITELVEEEGSMVQVDPALAMEEGAEGA